MKEFYTLALEKMLKSFDLPEDAHEPLEKLFSTGFAAALAAVTQKYGRQLNQASRRELSLFGLDLVGKLMADEDKGVKRGDVRVFPFGDNIDNVDEMEKNLTKGTNLIIEFTEAVDVNLQTSLSIILDGQLAANDGQSFLINRWPSGLTLPEFYSIAGMAHLSFRVGAYMTDHVYHLDNGQHWLASVDGWRLSG